MIPLLNILSPTPRLDDSRASGDVESHDTPVSLMSPPHFGRGPFRLSLDLSLISSAAPIHRLSMEDYLSRQTRARRKDPSGEKLRRRKRKVALGERLGSGISGTVYKLGSSEVVKCFFDDPQLKGHEAERGPLLALRLRPHRNLVLPTRIYAVNPDQQVKVVGRGFMAELGEEDQLIGEVSPYFEGRTLSQMLEEQGPLPSQEIRAIALQTIHGLQHLHKFGVLHRDMKPDNILINEQGQVKLIDWGLAVLQAREPNTPVGTVQYQAPETLRSEVQDEQADAFSLGSTLYQLRFGQHKADSECEALTYKPEEDPRLQDTTDPMVILLRGLLQPNPAQRMTLAEAAAKLRDMRR